MQSINKDILSVHHWGICTLIYSLPKCTMVWHWSTMVWPSWRCSMTVVNLGLTVISTMVNHVWNMDVKWPPWSYHGLVIHTLTAFWPWWEYWPWFNHGQPWPWFDHGGHLMSMFQAWSTMVKILVRPWSLIMVKPLSDHGQTIVHFSRNRA